MKKLIDLQYFSLETTGIQLNCKYTSDLILYSDFHYFGQILSPNSQKHEPQQETQSWEEKHLVHRSIFRIPCSDIQLISNLLLYRPHTAQAVIH